MRVSRIDLSRQAETEGVKHGVGMQSKYISVSSVTGGEASSHVEFSGNDEWTNSASCPICLCIHRLIPRATPDATNSNRCIASISTLVRHFQVAVAAAAAS